MINIVKVLCCLKFAQSHLILKVLFAVYYLEHKEQCHSFAVFFLYSRAFLRLDDLLYLIGNKYKEGIFLSQRKKELV